MDGNGFIFLMNEDEAQFFASELTGFSWYQHVTSRAELNALCGALPGPARLIAFCSNIIVPEEVIIALSGDCYNFHPGPPDRPGSHPTAFAATEQASEHGVTFHRMTKAVDAGPIVRTERFSVQLPYSEQRLSEQTYLEMLRMVQQLAPQLSNFSKPLKHSGEVWTNKPTTKVQHRLHCLSSLQIGDRNSGR